MWRAFLGAGCGAALLAGCASVPESCRLLAAGAAQDRIGRLTCLSDRGVQDAQVELARSYETGAGVPRDPDRAAALYELAARVAPSAQTIYVPPARLGGSGSLMHLSNPNATPGSAEARFRLGRLLIEGPLRRTDLRRGAALIEAAARMGHPEARQWLSERRGAAPPPAPSNPSPIKKRK